MYTFMLLDTISFGESLNRSDAHLVSYGAMSKAPLSLPTSLFIFKNLTAQGFMMSHWFKQHTFDERKNVMNELIGMMEAGAVSFLIYSL